MADPQHGSLALGIDIGSLYLKIVRLREAAGGERGMRLLLPPPLQPGLEPALLVLAGEQLIQETFDPRVVPGAQPHVGEQVQCSARSPGCYGPRR